MENEIKYSMDGVPSRVDMEIDDYWKEHIDERIKNIPEGKTFIVCTDWHFTKGGSRNSRKTTALIKYIREKTGIKRVLHLGDPIRSEATFEETKMMLSVSMEEYFYDVFGKDGLFAVGNHDTNVTRWLSASRREENPEVEGVDGSGAFNYLATQEDVYNVSVKNIEDMVCFDEKMLAKLDSLDYPYVGKEDGVHYSPEEMRRQAQFWARMHYHYDDTESKIRYIVMDTGDCGLMGFYVLKMLWTAIFPVEYDWLAETLMSTPEGYDIAVVGHMFATQRPGEGGGSHGIYKILQAFRAKSKVEFDVPDKCDNAKILIGDMHKSYDFTDSNFNKTIFTMAGHWHRERCYIWYNDEDGTEHVNETYEPGKEYPSNAMFNFLINNDCFEKPADELDCEMIPDTVTENTFDIVTIKDDGKIPIRSYMKKFLLSILLIILAIFVLASCGEKAEKKPAVSLDADGYYTKGTATGEFSWSLDEAGVLKITMEEGNKAKQFDASNAEYLLAIEPLRDKVTHIEIERFAGKIVYSGERAITAVGSAERNLCAAMPNLVSVHFAGNKQNFWVEENNAETSGLFYGSSSLKTVWFGDEKEENVIDLSGVGYGTPSNRDNYFSESLFCGCSAIEKVIFPRQIKKITEISFAGCTSLKEIILGMGISEIGTRAFSDCTSLVSISFDSIDFVVGENAFPDNEGLVISVKNEESRTAIEGVCNLTKAEIYVPLDEYWLEHIDEQLATLPEGRSFIAITDTHYSSGGGNIGKSAKLMDYVRGKTGIEKVINLGDPHHGENTYEVALEQLQRSMETQFFDFFGEDGMYAIGNHDSNLTASRNSKDEDAATFDMDILLSDKDIYDATFSHIEEGGKKNGNVVYDEALLAIIEENKGEITDFILDDVMPEDAEAYNNMFGDVSYTAEEMYENLVSWAKMHYAYYDHNSKICYIVLNTGGLTVTDFAILNRELWKFHPSQYEFLATMLNEISENYSDYDIVVAGHMFYDKSSPNESYHKVLFEMLSAFEGGDSVSFSASGNNAFSGKLFGCEDGANSRTLSYDFSGSRFRGEVICITGHRHLDLDLVSQTKDGKYYMSVPYDEVEDDLSDNAIQLILLNQDNASENNSDAEPNAEKPIKGTITEQSFTIFTITDDKTLVATRIGANSGEKQKIYKLG